MNRIRINVNVNPEDISSDATPADATAYADILASALETAFPAADINISSNRTQPTIIRADDDDTLVEIEGVIETVWDKFCAGAYTFTVDVFASDPIVELTGGAFDAYRLMSQHDAALTTDYDGCILNPPVLVYQGRAYTAAELPGVTLTPWGDAALVLRALPVIRAAGWVIDADRYEYPLLSLPYDTLTFSERVDAVEDARQMAIDDARADQTVGAYPNYTARWNCISNIIPGGDDDPRIATYNDAYRYAFDD